MKNTCNIVLTGFYKNHIKIEIKDNVFYLQNAPYYVKNNYIIIDFRRSNDSLVFEKKIYVSSIPCEFPHVKLIDGTYHLYLFCKSHPRFNSFFPLNCSQGLPLVVENGVIKFTVAQPFETNKGIFLNLSNDFFIQHNTNIVRTKIFITDEVRRLALNITRYSFSNYEKILAVHNWVCNNIYYDVDALEDGSYVKQKHDYISVLQRKRTVCQGYSELTKALLCSIGVHAINMYCFALGYSTKGDWSSENNMKEESNHVITFAYADDRWIMMDTTWDSDNEYKNGKFKQKTGFGTSHQYFDCTLAYFSYTHRFIL